VLRAELDGFVECSGPFTVGARITETHRRAPPARGGRNTVGEPGRRAIIPCSAA
jgi:hypothetical protein